jgi:hypothetical protein
VPASIDSSGGTDVAGALQQFVDGVPDGSTIVFRSGGTYRMGHSLRLSGRRDLVFEGNGATLRATGPGHLVTSSPFLIERDSRRITLRHLTLVGNNAEAGTADTFHPGAENQMGVAIYGSSDIELADVTMRRFYGDCLYIGSGAGQVWSERIRVHDSRCSLIGRSAVTIMAARDVTIERVVFDEIGMFVINLEPDYTYEGATGIVVRDNTIGSYGLTRHYTSWVLSAGGAHGATIRGVSLVGNAITGSASSGHEGKALGLHVEIDGSRGPRLDIVVRDNTSTRTVAGPSVIYRNVTGGAITGNQQPLSTGQLATLPGSSGVTYQP